MTTTKRNLIGLMAVTLLIAMTPIQQASAKVKFRANINTPHLSVRVGNSPVLQRYTHLQRLPVRQHMVVRIHKQDRRMAKRLARYTGISKRELLQLRKSGYSWREIGRWLNLRPQVVQAARNAHTWERFLNHGRPVVRCSTR